MPYMDHHYHNRVGEGDLRAARAYYRSSRKSIAKELSAVSTEHDVYCIEVEQVLKILMGKDKDALAFRNDLMTLLFNDIPDVLDLVDIRTRLIRRFTDLKLTITRSKQTLLIIGEESVSSIRKIYTHVRLLVRQTKVFVPHNIAVAKTYISEFASQARGMKRLSSSATNNFKGRAGIVNIIYIIDNAYSFIKEEIGGERFIRNTTQLILVGTVTEFVLKTLVASKVIGVAVAKGAVALGVSKIFLGVALVISAGIFLAEGFKLIDERVGISDFLSERLLELWIIAEVGVTHAKQFFDEVMKDVEEIERSINIWADEQFKTGICQIDPYVCPYL